MTSRGERALRLTSSQRRHLEVSLGQVLNEMEEAALWFKRWPLPGESQDKVLAALEALAEGIGEMTRNLGLRPAALRPDPRRKLASMASHWWETTLNCRSQILRGYGELDPGTAPRLDPLVDQLAASLFRLAALGRDGGEEGQGEAGS